MQQDNTSGEAQVGLTAEIVSAYVSNNPVPASDLPALIGSIHEALGKLSRTQEAAEKPKPAVSIAKSVTRDHIICLEDGLKFKSLKRHLATKYGLTPEEYRDKWGLPRDYPMVAPSYSEARSALAKELGLGRKAEVPAPKKSGRERRKAA